MYSVLVTPATVFTRYSGAGETPEDGVAVPAGVILEDAVPDGEAVPDGVYEVDMSGVAAGE